MPSGRIWWRNRHFLSPFQSPSEDPQITEAIPVDAQQPRPALTRRSARIKENTACYKHEGGGGGEM
ncbi:hypothetical protein E2C01_076585 [Portunus trituberculatus]|uniref:Uncharacterized protein n=1 Tax=Portunus trituberculatus TaxID=210409 RepID=A0A5B7INY5_PORTR|nr:hypothetical protein [Portunus trituberculatus]